jgi:UDP-N-acetylglucosamine--N-acetylmuramyl-(pentapeptide) pyrophosphoryl-undecaprenol N-acetylglucosamine transferase
MPSQIHLVFSGGGTGGHLFPGLAVAERIRRLEPSAQITFAGGGTEWERRHVRTEGYEYFSLPCHRLPRRPWEAIRFVRQNLQGYQAAAQFIHDRQPSAVIGLGGYASVPMARAAVTARVPLVLLEQNAVPGRANRWLAPKARTICTSFGSSARILRSRGDLHVTGNPIRSGFSHVPAMRGDFLAARTLLVLGGSRGAQSLNLHLPQALAIVSDALTGWQVIHQTGVDEVESTRERYRTSNLPVTVTPFVEDLPSVLSQVGLAVCRAGGSTLAELSAAGVPALLVPYPHAADDHQRQNAAWFADAGACLAVDVRETGSEFVTQLSQHLRELLTNSRRRQFMSQVILELSHPNAAGDVALKILEAIEQNCRSTPLAATRKAA